MGESFFESEEAEAVKAKKKEIQTIEAGDRKSRYLAIIRGLNDASRIRYVDIPFESYKNVQTLQSLPGQQAPNMPSDPEGYSKKLADLINAASTREDSGDAKGQLGDYLDEVFPQVSAECGTVRLNYFFLGDLLEVVLRIVLDNPESVKTGEFEDIKFLIGSFVWERQTAKEVVPIPSLPISLNYFNSYSCY